MSLFGSLMGDLEDDSIFGLHMRSLRQMNNMMNSMMSDPFGMFRGLEAITGPSALTGQMNNRNSLMPFNFPDINTNRLLGAGGNNYYQQPDGGMSFSSSSYVSMTRGPDGRPQIYKATSSSKSGPGGIRETKKTVQDSRTGVSKMAIGQHIGERAHVVERQKNSHTGEEEETVDLINVDETDADEFNREFERKAREGVSSRRYGQQQQLAIAAPPTSSIRTTPQSKMTTQVPQHQQQQQQQYTHSNRRGLRNVLVTPRRHLRSPTSSLLALPSTSHSTLPTSVHPHPYNPTSRRHHRAMKGTQQQHQQQQQHQHQQQQQQHQHHQQQQHQQQHNNSTSGSGTR